MTDKENIIVRFLQWLGLIKKTEVNKSVCNRECEVNKSVCNRECDECIWNMYDCTERKEE